MIPNYAFKTLLNFTMYVVNQKKKKEKKLPYMLMMSIYTITIFVLFYFFV